MSNCLRKGNNGGFGRWKQTSKVHWKYLAFKSLKRSSELSQECWFCMLQCNRPRTDDVFRGRNAKIKVRLTHVKVWKLEKMPSWCFWRPNNSMKHKNDIFRGRNRKSKVWLVYLEVKMHQDRCAWCIYNLKATKWQN